MIREQSKNMALHSLMLAEKVFLPFYECKKGYFLSKKTSGCDGHNVDRVMSVHPSYVRSFSITCDGHNTCQLRNNTLLEKQDKYVSICICGNCISLTSLS